MRQIVLIEDDQDLNAGIRMALAQSDITFLPCYRIDQAREILENVTPDLMILDINLPDGSGMDFLREIRQDSSVPVILLTAKDMETDVVAGLAAGADDYVTKPFSLAILRARVEVQLRKCVDDGERIYKMGNYQFDFEHQIFERDEMRLELSRTEQRILYYLVKNCGHQVPREQLKAYVWQDGAAFMDENSLSVAVNRLRTKLQDRTYLKTVYGIGYCWDEEA